MKVRCVLRYSAPPDLVGAMLISPEFQRRIADALESPECSVVASDTAVTTVMVLPTADPLDKVAGRHSKQIGVLEWKTPLTNNRREGHVAIRIERFPVHFGGPVYLAFNEATGVTTVDYDTDLNLNIPVLELSTQRAVADRTYEVIMWNQQLGEDWLRQHGIAHPEPPA